jgi:hypothetical protein
MPTPLEEATMQATIDADNARLAVMARAWDAYDGRFPDPLKVERGEPNDNIKVNRVKAVVRASVALQFGRPPSFELPKTSDGEDSSERSPEEAWLDECLRRSNWPRQLLNLGTNGGVCGTAYLRIVLATPYPSVQVMDPSSMAIRWNPKNMDEVTSYIWTYNSFDPATRKPIIVRQVAQKDDAGRWTILDQHATLGTDSKVLGWVDDASTMWPYEWPPYLHCQNLPRANEVYGEPDVTDTLIGLNRAKNFNLSNRRRIDRLHGHPIPYGTGLAGLTVDAAPGKLLQLPAGSTVGIISPSINSDAAAGLGKEIDESIELESMTPNILLGRVDQSSIPASGVALQIRLHPALVKLEMKRTTYEPLIVDLLSRLLEIGNRGRGVVAVVKWPEPIPTDMEALRRALLIDQQIGVASKATLADKLGYDWANEQENLDQEGSNAMLPSPNDFTNRPGQGIMPGGMQDGGANQ